MASDVPTSSGFCESCETAPISELLRVTFGTGPGAIAFLTCSGCAAAAVDQGTRTGARVSVAAFPTGA
jgi:hypothetical protein